MSNPPPRLHDALVHNGRRQEFEIAHLELTVLFDQNDLDVEVWLKVRTVFQLLHGGSLRGGHSFNFLRRQFSVWICPRKLARRMSAGIQSGIAPMANMESIAPNCSLLRRFKTSGSVENTWSILGARGGPCAASTYCIRYANCSAVTFPNGFNSFC